MTGGAVCGQCRIAEVAEWVRGRSGLDLRGGNVSLKDRRVARRRGVPLSHNDEAAFALMTGSRWSLGSKRWFPVGRRYKHQ